MKNTLIKFNRFYKDGFALNSKYWQDFKKSLSATLPNNLHQIAIGMLLGDACIQKIGKFPFLKFEQGYKQMELLFHLYEVFSSYILTSPYTRYEKYGPRKGEVKSYSVRTFSHVAFLELYELFIVNGVKVITAGLITNHLTPLGLAYWIMCDGSLDGNTMILHTQSFTKEEIIILSSELNTKFNLNSFP